MPNFTMGTLSLDPKNKQVLIAGCAEERHNFVFCGVISLRGENKWETIKSLFSVVQQWGSEHLIGTSFNVQLLLTRILHS